MMGRMIRARIPALDRIAHALERRALRRLDARAQRPGSHSWHAPDRLWPNFGDD